MRLFVSFSQSCQKSHEYALIKAARRGKGPGILVYVLLCCLLCSVEECYDLGAGAGVVRREAAVTCAFGYAVCDCPVDGVVVERRRRNVGEAAHGAHSRRIFHTVQECHYLTAGAGVVRGKPISADAGGDAVCDRPLDRLVVERAGLNVGKAHIRAHRRLTSRAPQECYDLAARALSVGVKAIIAHTGGYLILYRPLDSVCIERIGGNVNKAHGRLVIGVFSATAGADAADVAVTQRIGVATLIAVVADRAGVGRVACRRAGRSCYCRGVAMRMGCLIIRVFRIAAGTYSANIVVAEGIHIGVLIAVSAGAGIHSVATQSTGRSGYCRGVAVSM